MAPRMSLRGSILRFDRGYPHKERKLLKKLLTNVVNSCSDTPFLETMVDNQQSNVKHQHGHERCNTTQQFYEIVKIVTLADKFPTDKILFLRQCISMGDSQWELRGCRRTGGSGSRWVTRSESSAASRLPQIHNLISGSDLQCPSAYPPNLLILSGSDLQCF